jgi:hypothetical protein
MDARKPAHDRLWVAKDGTRHGDPIPGSKWYRWFCGMCATPLRSMEPHPEHAMYCEECDPKHTGVGNSFPSGKDDVDAFGRSE